MNSLRILVLAASVGALLAVGAGCGATFEPYAPIQAPADAFANNTNAATATSAPGTDGNFLCPATSNTSPSSDQSVSGAGYYTVCPDKTATDDVLVNGATSGSNEICAFPAQAASTSLFYPITSGTSGPLMQCQPITSNGVIFTFQGVTFNAIYIVTQQDEQQMANCLSQMNSYLCPAYSAGQFR